MWYSFGGGVVVLVVCVAEGHCVVGVGYGGVVFWEFADGDDVVVFDVGVPAAWVAAGLVVDFLFAGLFAVGAGFGFAGGFVLAAFVVCVEFVVHGVPLLTGG